MTQGRRNKIIGIIRKHYGKQSYFKTRGWEQCGREIERFIEKEQGEFSFLPYKDRCDKDEQIRREIEREYESYFKVGSGFYNWINGNSKLTELLNY